MILLTSDIHLTDNPDDDYKWKLFYDINNICEEHNVSEIYILGDITTAKDNHSSEFVNSVVSYFKEINRPTYILKGNHDYKVGVPFFKFLEIIPNVTFINDISYPSSYSFCLFLPHTRTPKEDWAEIDFNKYDYVFMHQTINQAVLSTNIQARETLGASFFNLKGNTKIYSGDVHIPQTIGPVTYVGSPYHNNYGDTYNGSLLLLDPVTGEETPISYLASRKLSVTIKGVKELKNIIYRKGDKIKIKVELSDTSAEEWRSIESSIYDYFDSKGVSVRSVIPVVERKRKIRGNAIVTKEEALEVSTDTHKNIVERFCDREKIANEVKDTGLGVLDEF